MLMDKVKEYYLNYDYNCAETVVMAANDEYNLGIEKKDVRLVSGFGAGFGAKETCGALCGAMAVLSVMCVETRAHATENFAEICSGYLSRFKQTLGSDNCEILQGKYRCEETRCLKTVELAVELLQQYITELGKLPKDDNK